MRHWVSLTLFFLGLLVNSTGDYAQADEYFRESLACGRLSGSPRMISMTAVFSAPTLLALGRYAEAEEWLQEGLALARTCGDRWLQGTALGRLGMVMAAQGDRPGARSALLEAQALAQEAGNLWDLAWVQAGLGDVYLSQGDAAQADLHYRAALQLATESNAIPIALDALAGFATLAAQAGDRERALELAGHVSVHPASSSNARARAAEVLRGVALDPSPAAGSFEDIVHRILAGSSPSSSRALI